MLKEIGQMDARIHFGRMKRGMIMRHGLIFRLLVISTALVLPGSVEARSGHYAGSFRNGNGHPGGGVTSHFRGTHAWLGADTAGTSHRFDAGGHEGSGWYHRAWGGTMAPGWGYGFSPNLGGSGGP